MPSPIMHFRKRLKAGDVCIGPSITLADPLITEALGESVDFFWIDLEHSPMSLEIVTGHLLAAREKQTGHCPRYG
jgi:2-keto-3-deoxy-L-rhamnonate aldolase RhmA